MENYKKIKVANSTYVYNTNSSSNFYKKDKLLVGAINTRNKHFKLYKSLLKVSKTDLRFNSNENVYLFLFVENMYIDNGNTVKFSIFGNDDDFITSNIDWNNFPKKNADTRVDVSISSQSIGDYIKIDITPIIKSLSSYSRSYNLILEAINPSNLPYMIQFNSCNGKNIPYLAIASSSTYNSIGNIQKITTNQRNEDTNKNLNKGQNNSYIDEYYANIINRINNQNLKLDTLDKNLTNIFSSLETKVNNIRKDDIDLNNKITSEFSQINEIFSVINNTMSSLKDYFETLKNETNSINEIFPKNSLNNIASDLNELTKSEILQLKNSLNNDIINLKSSINSDISSLNNSIKNLDNTLSAIIKSSK